MTKKNVEKGEKKNWERGRTLVVTSASSISIRRRPDTEMAPKSTSTISAVAGITYEKKF